MRLLTVILFLVSVSLSGQHILHRRYITAESGFTDDFEAYSAGTINSQGLWVVEDGDIDVIEQFGDKRANGGTSSFNVARYNETFTDDQYAQVVMDSTTQTSGYMGPAVRIATGASTYYVWYINGNDSQCRRFNDGVYDVIISGGDPASDGDIVELRIVGYELQFYKNDELDTSMSGDGLYEDADGDKITSGQPGIGGRYSNANMTIDDFKCGDL